jgi:peptidyl-prolyl cis-trans isomerase D
MLQRIRDGFGRSVIIVILGLIAVSFIFWGIDFNFTGPSYAAKVNGEEISLEEFERNLQAEQSNFLELYRVELDEDIRRQLRAQVLDRMVRQRALAQRVEELGYRVSDERLAASVQSIPMFQVCKPSSRSRASRSRRSKRCSASSSSCSICRTASRTRRS